MRNLNLFVDNNDTVTLSHAHWSDLLLGNTTFRKLGPSLLDVDTAITIVSSCTVRDCLGPFWGPR